MDKVKVTSQRHDGVVMSSRDAARTVIEVVRDGGLAVVPFDVAYAFLGATRGALELIYALKVRPAGKPCPMLASWEHFLGASAADPERIRAIQRVADAGLPVGLITSTNWQSDLVGTSPDDCREMLAKDGKLALFINMGGIGELLIEEADAIGLRLFGSSANISGTGNSFRLDELPDFMLENVDITCEAGDCRYTNAERMAASIVDVDATAVVRIGILHEEIERLMRQSDEGAAGC